MERMKTIHFTSEADGDETDFASVYKKHYHKVYNYVYRMLLHRQNAEDVVSDAFYKAMLSFDSYDASKGSVSTWLCGIAHHCAVNFLLSKAHRSRNSLKREIFRRKARTIGMAARTNGCYGKSCGARASRSGSF